ncbi:NmrA/HSCARG family protein [Nocardioides ganghwensis]|uniref:NmrA/HSCARG family protein n=1 Tax=Nocardioides ganghwensis TaxID=252230 RepID=A0A4Q2SHX1_9ACTN|nr:NmrA/HSCARG family protein [Nocardioides ganghwensis]MBD3944871.1 NmrA/HSCARG family protein [Nocardioides ganghwensis]RYC05115.1 NmrA/HSCARG family protein [Nocardioides ganghwensis]
MEIEEVLMARDELIVVTGATGRQGGAVARHLLADGWRVRGVTRSAGSAAARELARRGVEVVTADMGDLASLGRAFAGAYGVYSVQNAMTATSEGEVAQGRNVATAAAEAGVSHLVHGSAGPGTPGTGVAAWDGKLEVAAYARSRGLSLTVLRPTAFMELMTDKDLYPPVAAWHLMPRIVGEDRPLPWLCADDLGAIAAQAFADPATYAGLDIGLAADVRTIAQCRADWRAVTGRSPRRFPMPLWLFERFVGQDLTRMWRWLATHDIPADVDRTRSLLPTAVTVEEFLRRRLA